MSTKDKTPGEREKALIKNTKAAWERKEASEAAAAAEIIEHSSSLSRFKAIRQRWSVDAATALAHVHPQATEDLLWLIQHFGVALRMHLETMSVTHRVSDLLVELAEANGDVATFSGTILLIDEPETDADDETPETASA